MLVQESLITYNNNSNNNITQSAAVAHMPSTHAPILIGRATYIHTNIR